jgi:hypothetical protein
LFRACFVFQLHLHVLGNLFTDAFAAPSWLHGDVTSIKLLVTRITFCIAALWTQKFFHVKDLNRKMLKLITNAYGILVHFPTAAVQEAKFKGGCCRYSEDN